MSGIIIAAVVVSCTGLLLGLFLGVMGKKFYVEVDQKEIDVRAELPGNNCGGCGYAGCDALAKAIAAGEAPANACPVGGAPVASKIGAIMGEEVGESVRMTAFVKCAGDCDKAKENYVYSGAMDCTAMNVVPNGGSKACTYGCMGYGSCVKACPFDAIHIVNGIAVVDKGKCKACGKCVAVCPRHLIEIIPYKSNYTVNCSSNDKGKDVMSACSVGCIGCMLCTKQCEFGAITVENNIAHIDYSKCTGCGTVLNTALPRANQYFTAWHEIYHLIFDKVSFNHFIEIDNMLEERKAECFAACMLLKGVERYYEDLTKMDFISKIFYCMATFQAPYKSVLVSLYEYAVQSKNEELCCKIKEVFDLQFDNLAEKFQMLGLDDSLVTPSYVINTSSLQEKIKKSMENNPELNYHKDNEAFLKIL